MNEYSFITNPSLFCQEKIFAPADIGCPVKKPRLGAILGMAQGLKQPVSSLDFAQVTHMAGLYIQPNDFLDKSIDSPYLENRTYSFVAGKNM